MCLGKASARCYEHIACIGCYLPFILLVARFWVGKQGNANSTEKSGKRNK